ncbi:PLP-dependent aminotransferase family protein [Pelomonas sp. SE-A7]|uniref:MocR-like pyridoxine biosynthesis transcription factor PdxR n=1 Tax=Pelomonas sp. SE-A7 TaxID=3054953 RepID=UPI00259CA9AC|nr:PLP-dependent aminotransferase family protein [Pelomonas sp. SE-A7]MDM4767932.1 PLP-dependent aminotransferase family protein [Pelomonas sp. SE-A7]
MSARPGLWMQLLDQAMEPGLGRREQLVAALRHGIRSGALRRGDRLPASRQLAEDLGLSRVTVEAAYGRLETEGYLRREVGRGSFVAIDTGRALPDVRSARTMVAAAPVLSTRGQRIADGGGCIDPARPLPFAAGSPELRAFPLALWRQLLNRRLRRQPGLLGYGDPQGLPELRETIAAYLNTSRGLRCRPEQVLVLSSSQQALQLAALMLLDADDCVWMEEPGYRGAVTAFEAAGARLQPVPLDREGLRPDPALPSPRLVYLTPSHQYPCGMALSLPRRLALLEMARREQAWIIEDDYDSEFHYDGRPMPALQGLDEHGRVLYVGTFSKVLFPSLRLAYLVLPEALVAPFVTARTTQDGHAAQLPQAVAADFLRQGHFAAHLRLMRRLYQQRRDCLLQALQPIRAWLEPQPGPGGLQLAALLPRGEEARFTRAAAALGLLTPGLSALYQGPLRQDGWLLGYSALTPDEIAVACHSLGQLKITSRR